MKKLGCLVIGLSMLVCGIGTVLAEDGIEFGISADYFGKYIWRGQNLNDDGAFQPGISASYGGFTGAIWGSVDTTSINNNSGEITEADYSLDYSGSLPGLEGVGYSLGIINYVFPNTAVDDTTEVYAGLSFDLPLGPSITVYRDVDDVKGTYISLGVGHSIEKIAELAPDTPVGMDISASLGWASSAYNKFYWGTDQSKMNDLAFSVSFPMEIAGWTVAPSLNYVTLVSDDIRDTDTYGTGSDFFFAGIGLSKSF